MAYGLKNNVYGTLFSDAIATMMAMADQFQEIKQLCHCGRKATMILKFDRSGEAVRSGEVVEIGGEGRYVSVCRRHWTAGDIGPAARRLVDRQAMADGVIATGFCDMGIALPQLLYAFVLDRGWASSNASMRRFASILV